MKKFSIRTLLVLVLALVMAFSLVACGDKGGGGGDNPAPTPTPTTQEVTAVEYFNKLWDLSKGIGSEKIGKDDNLAVSADLSLSLGTENSAGKVFQKVDLGVSIDLVLDKSAKAATDQSQTAAKIRLYDPTGNETWVTAYVFMNDPTCIYLDFAGQYIKMPFNYRNTDLSARLDQFFTQDKTIVLNKDTDKRQELTVAELLTKFTDDMGSDWNINKLISRIVDLTGADLKDILSKGIAGGLVKALFGGVDNLFDANGNLDLHGVLTSELGASLFDKSSVTTNGDVKTYYTQVETKTLGLVSGFVSGLDQLLDATAKVSMTFNERAGEMEGFGLRVQFANSISATDPTAVPKQKVFPVLNLNINKLSFRKATGSDITTAVARENYKTDVALDMGVAVDVTGVALDATALDARNQNRFSEIEGLNNFVLDGKLALTLKGKIDLWNKTGNTTTAVAALSYVPNKGDKIDIVNVSFVNRTLAFTVNQNAKVSNVPIASTVVKLWGDYAYNALSKLFAKVEGGQAELDRLAGLMFTDAKHRVLNPEFKGAAWRNIDIVTAIQNWLNGLKGNPLNSLKPATDSATTSTDSATTAAVNNLLGKIATTLKYGMPFFTSPDNNLVVTLDNLLKNVAKITGVWNSDLNESGVVDEIIKKDSGNWILDIKGLLKLAGLTIGGGKDVTAEDIAMFRNVEREKYKEINITPEEIAAERAKPGNEKKTDRELTDIIKNRKYAEMTAEQIDAAIIESNGKGKNGHMVVRFAGKNDDEVKAHIKADRDYLTSVMAGSAKVVLDMSWENGLFVSAEAKVADAQVKATVYVKATAFNAADYTDLAKDVTKDTAGWFLLEFAA